MGVIIVFNLPELTCKHDSYDEWLVSVLRR